MFKYIDPTPYVVRTMVYNCDIDHLINHKQLRKKLCLMDNDPIYSFTYKWANGKIIMKSKNTAQKPPKKLFNNQITVVVSLADGKHINCKVFKNGNIQMSGCRSEQDAKDATGIITKKLSEYSAYFRNDDDPRGKKIDYKIGDYSIRLINSNFRIKNVNNIDRFALVGKLIKAHDFLVVFDPNRYPGIKYPQFIDESVYSKSIIDICKWLKDIGADACIPVFHNNNIDGNALLDISYGKLLKMGVDNADLRKKIMQSINDKNMTHKITIIHRFLL